MMDANDIRSTACCMREFYARGIPFENTYMAIDVEATGIDDHTKHLPVQIGYLICQNGDTEHFASAKMLNWTICPTVDQKWLDHVLHFKANGVKRHRMYPFDYNTLRTRGEHYYDVLNEFYCLISDWQNNNGYFLFFNGIGFDMGFLQIVFKRFLNRDLMFNGERILDAGVNEKGIRLFPAILPKRNETIRDFHVRMINHPNQKGLRWKLDGHCFSKYDLRKKGLHPDELHFADKDCQATHYVYQSQRNFALGILRECDTMQESIPVLQAR